MTALDRAAGLASQSAAAVTRAEVKRMLRQGGLRRAAVVTVAISVIFGVGALLLLDQISGGQTQGVSGIPVESTSSLAGILMGLSVALHYGRLAQDGGIASALPLVPDRKRLLLAQFLATACGAFSVALLAAGVTALITGVVTQSLAPGAALAAIAAGGLAAALLALMAQATAYLAGGPVPALLIILGWWVFVPFMCAALSQMVAPSIARLLTLLGDWTPVSIQVRATSLGDLQASSVGPLVEDFGALALIAGILVWASIHVLSRRDF